MLKDKIKALVAKGEKGDSKKKIENLVVFLVILIVTIIIVNFILGGEKETEQEPASDPNKKLATTESTEKSISTANLATQNTLAMQLEEILQKIQGVGEVKVLITYSQTSQTVPMYNEDITQKDTEETDTSRWNQKSGRNRFF